MLIYICLKQVFKDQIKMLKVEYLPCEIHKDTTCTIVPTNVYLLIGNLDKLFTLLPVVTDETSGIMDQATSAMASEDETWNPRSGWNGPPAVLYRSFDNSHGLVHMERSIQISQVNLLSGKVI